MMTLHRLIGSDDRRQHPLSISGSGGEHSADECLSEMVVDFLEDGRCCRSRSPAGDFSDAAEMDDETAELTEAVGEIRRIVAVNDGNVEPYRELLVGNVGEASEMAAAFSSDGGGLRRRLMMMLRELHHNAAVCKTKWGSCRDVAAGDYEFVDVVNGNIRYLIDTNFPTQFEIARPTIQYTELINSLPLIFIGKAEELKKIVRIMCAAAKKSLNQMNLSTPPWRKYTYLLNKWLGPYRRTVNSVIDMSPAPVCCSVKCQWIGFDVASPVEVHGGASAPVRSIKAV